MFIFTGMKQFIKMKFAKILCIIVLIIGISALANAENPKRIAKITAIDGNASVMREDTQEWVPAEVGTELTEGDILKSKSDAWVLLFLDGTVETAELELSADSELLLSEFSEDAEQGTQKILLDLAMGEVLIRAQKLHAPDSSFEVKTPTSIVGVRGTTFAVKVVALE